MELYDDIKTILERRLERCLAKNNLNEFLFGLNSMFLKENPRDSKSDHDYFNTMLVYNKYNLKYPDLQLYQRYIQEVLKQLEKEDFFDIYSVYESLRAQIILEENGWASFNIDRNQLLNILAKIESLLENNKLYLEKYSYMKGSKYENGVYGYIHSSKKELYEHSNKIL